MSTPRAKRVAEERALADLDALRIEADDLFAAIARAKHAGDWRTCGTCIAALNIVADRYCAVCARLDGATLH